MAYENIFLGNFEGVKTYRILTAAGKTMKIAQSLCDSGRVVGADGRVLGKNELVFGAAYLVDYLPRPRGLAPIFEDDFIAAFDKPSGVLSHPNGRNSAYSLCDEIWARWGRGACVAHRLDRETSGVIVVAKTPAVARDLKRLFEAREVAKSYLALVWGRFSGGGLGEFRAADFAEFSGKFGDFQNTGRKFVADFAMRVTANYDDFKNRMVIAADGKRAVSVFEPILENLDLKKIFGEGVLEVLNLKNILNSKTTASHCDENYLNNETLLNSKNILNSKNSLNCNILNSNDFLNSKNQMPQNAAHHGESNATQTAAHEFAINAPQTAAASTIQTHQNPAPNSKISLIRCYPLTGRQHQLRLHLHHIGHTILGDPIYGQPRQVIEDILDHKLTPAERLAATLAPRLMLHAEVISFTFNNKFYEIRTSV